MRLRRRCLSFLASLASLASLAGTGQSVEKPVPFAVGEKLVFALKFMGIQAGVGEFGIQDIVEVRGRKCYRIVAKAYDIPPFSWIHRFEDRVESFMDVERLHTLRIVKSIREGGYEKDETLEFDQEKHVVTYIDKNGKTEKTEPIPPDCQDFLSAFFYFRTQPIEVGKNPSVKVHADGKNWDFTVKVVGKEAVKTLLGKQECFVVKPFMQFDAVFKQRGDVTMYVSQDHRLLPVYMKADAMKGAIYATLIEVVLPKEDIRKKQK